MGEVETPPAPKRIFDGDRVEIVQNINAYLLDGPNVLVESRNKSLCDVPPMVYGNKPVDGGALIIEAADYDEFIRLEPAAKKYIKNLLGAAEFINGKKRYCLWLVGVAPSELRKMPLVMERVARCRAMRETSVDAGARKLASRPTEFRDVNNPDAYLIVPRHSSENRRYIPFGFLSSETIASDAVLIIPDATLYHFGVMTSSVHMAWTRAVCGRLKSDYRYSATVVYNNFPWPTPTDAQRAEIERTARGILDARALYPESSLADLYDELVTPQELRDAHRRNDAAVERAFGFPKGAPEPFVVAELMKRYSKLSAGK